MNTQIVALKEASKVSLLPFHPLTHTHFIQFLFDLQEKKENQLKTKQARKLNTTSESLSTFRRKECERTFETVCQSNFCQRHQVWNHSLDVLCQAVILI
jgi:desulfoferrodoxin (superoxide reductase-like protein)